MFIESRSVDWNRGFMSWLAWLVTIEEKGFDAAFVDMPVLDKFILNEELDTLGDGTVGGLGIDDEVDGELHLTLPGLLFSCTVFTVTVVPAGMFLVKLSALLAASDKLLVLVKLFL